ERLPLLPPDARQAAAERYLAAEKAVEAAEGCGSESLEVMEEALALIAEPELAALFDPGVRAEVKLSGTIEISGITHRVTGRIDRIVPEADGLLLVDLKTDRAPPATLPPTYVIQLALYRALLQKIQPDQ